MFIQTQDGAFVRRVGSGNIEWDASHFQTAASLTEEERAALGVFELVDAEPPTFNEDTQILNEVDPTLIDGAWARTWEIVDLDEAEQAALLAQRKYERLAELADIRWQHETGGMILPTGQPLLTDRETQGKLTSAYVQAAKNPSFAVEAWKLAPGVYTALDAATIIVIGDALTAFVQACFTREKELNDLILDEGVTSASAVREIDLTTGWPGDDS